MNTIINRLLIAVMLLSFTAGFTACGDDDDDNTNKKDEQLKEEEQDLYDEYVTEEMQTAITKLGMPVNRGINPPNVEGYYRMEPVFLATTNSSENSYLGMRWNTDLKFNFYDQKDLAVSLLGYEVSTNTDRLTVEHSGEGTFITGKDNKFSIFMEEQSVSNGYTSTTLTIISGEVIRTGNKITSMKDLRYAFIMKDRGGNPNVILVGQGRVFKDDEVNVITKEQFEKLTKSASLKSGDSTMSFISKFN